MRSVFSNFKQNNTTPEAFFNKKYQNFLRNSDHNLLKFNINLIRDIMYTGKSIDNYISKVFKITIKISTSINTQGSKIHNAVIKTQDINDFITCGDIKWIHTFMKSNISQYPIIDSDTQK